MVTTKPSSSSSSSSSSSTVSGASAAESLSLVRCASSKCGNFASLKCPTCVQLNLTPTLFCSQECFKSNWKTHNAVHKLEKARVEFMAPAFPYSGSLRPSYVTPQRTVSDDIMKPDYALSGQPISEQLIKSRSTIIIYSKEEIEGVRKACKIGREALDLAHRMIRPGVTTEAIDVAVHEYIISQGAYPSPLNYYDFPKSICTSVNETICHGIPDARKLEDGDIVNVDVSVYYKGFHGDLNETYTVGKVDSESKNLIKVTYDALEQCIQHVRPGVLVREFGDIITKYVSKFGFSVVRSFVGHGIGRVLHAPPDIPHYAKNKAIGTLKAGMIFTIEPMINAGTYRDVKWPDDWTYTTADGKRSAQFEHTMLVTETGVEVLTARTDQSPKLWWQMEENIPSESHAHTANGATQSATPAASASAASWSSDSVRIVSELNDRKDRDMKVFADVDVDDSVTMSKKKKKNKKNKSKVSSTTSNAVATADVDNIITAAEGTNQ